MCQVATRTLEVLARPHCAGLAVTASGTIQESVPLVPEALEGQDKLVRRTQGDDIGAARCGSSSVKHRGRAIYSDLSLHRAHQPRSTSLALGDLLVGAHLNSEFCTLSRRQQHQVSTVTMQPTAVRMADKLRILIPVKRVIDYAVCFHHEHEGRAHRTTQLQLSPSSSAPRPPAC